MKKLIFLLTLMALIATQAKAQTTNLTEIIQFISAEEGAKLLTTEDDFTRSWSQFDIDSRMQKSGSTKEAVFQMIAEEVRDFSEAEISQVRNACEEIEAAIRENEFKINFPEKILFVKTTAREEGGAVAYTRSNYIVLGQGIFNQPAENLKKTLIHEIFHLLTRADNEFRQGMYSLIGFKMMPAIDYPAEIKELRITNPDAPQTDSYTTLTFNGQPTDCMMVLYASKAYTGGSFFTYLQIGFLALEGDEQKTPQMKDGKAVIYNFQEASDFFEKVGQNTQYIIHPEEIMADNFSYALLSMKGLKDQWLIDAITGKLRETE